MRRTDKEIAKEEIEKILHGNKICRIALARNNIPYIFPMNYGFSNNAIYLHSASDSTKLDIIRENPAVCFEISDSIEIAHSEKACSFGTKYRSVIGHGKIKIIEDPVEKKESLQQLMRQHTNTENWELDGKLMQKVAALRIEIKSISGKKSGF